MNVDPLGKDFLQELWTGVLAVTGIVATIVAGVFGGPEAAAAVAGAFAGIIDNEQNGGNWLAEVAGGAVGGYLFAAAGPAYGISGAAVAVAKAGSQQGNFFNNLIGNGSNLFISGYESWFLGAAIIPGLPSAILPALSSTGLVYNAVSLADSACDPVSGGAINSGFCSGVEARNGQPTH